MDQEELHLTPIEYKLLCLLSKNVGKVLTHNFITRQTWGSSWENDVASLRVFMATLRKKIEKYPLKKMLNFAWDGITSFSVKPLRMICTLGFVILFISILIMIYSLIRKCTGNVVDGWTFLNISIWFIGGLQMISLGIIGEYVGKMYNETKARPRFIVAKNLEVESKN